MSDDPYKYFRIEAREILDGLSAGLLRVEKSGISPGDGEVDTLMRLAHTLKGAAGVVDLSEMSVLAHRLEDILAGYRGPDAPSAVAPEDMEAALAALDANEARFASLLRDGNELADSDGASAAGTTLDTGSGAGPTPGGSDASIADGLESIRVNTGEMDDLISGLVQVGVEVVGLEQTVDQLDAARQTLTELAASLDMSSRRDGYGLGPEQLRARRQELLQIAGAEVAEIRRELSDRIGRLGREIADMRAQGARMRLVPASMLRSVLERAVRNAAKTADKQVNFRFEGEDVRLDAVVLAGVREALLHLVRNAVAHGIETPRRRQAAGKPTGSIDVRLSRQADRVRIVCADDGAGIDTGAVGELAAARGLIAREEVAALTVERAITLLLGGSALSTTTDADALSGRGLGLAIVHRAVSELHGTLRMESQPGSGTQVELTVPVSAAWMTVLALRGVQMEVAVPLDAVIEVRTVRPTEIFDSRGVRCIEVVDGVAPIEVVDRVVSGAQAGSGAASRTGIVLRTPVGPAVLTGRHVVGTEEVVVEPLPDFAGAGAVVTGAYVNASGRPRLVLDPTAVAQMLRAGTRPIIEAASAPRLPRVLVIDDSLTTRMLERSILESAGFDVDLVASGEEGLEAARRRPYGIFLVDVEMPGMNGFEFVAQTRRDPELRDVPSILITSRSAPEDRRRGQEVGAMAYIVKGEFDQRHLLETIHRLTAPMPAGGEE